MRRLPGGFEDAAGATAFPADDLRLVRVEVLATRLPALGLAGAALAAVACVILAVRAAPPGPGPDGIHHDSPEHAAAAESLRAQFPSPALRPEDQSVRR